MTDYYLTDQECYGVVAGEMFAADEVGWLAPQEVLKTLEPEIVERALRYANETSATWPPAPSGAIGWVRSL